MILSGVLSIQIHPDCSESQGPSSEGIPLCISVPKPVLETPSQDRRGGAEPWPVLECCSPKKNILGYNHTLSTSTMTRTACPGSQI